MTAAQRAVFLRQGAHVLVFFLVWAPAVVNRALIWSGNVTYLGAFLQTLFLPLWGFFNGLLYYVS